MKKWFVSLRGAITLSVLSLLVYLARTFIDFYYVFQEFGLGIGMIAIVILVEVSLFGGWIGGLLTAVQQSRRGMWVVLIFDLFFLLLIGVGTLVSYCPSPCSTAWPLGEIAIWASLVFGVLGAGSAAAYLRDTKYE